VARIAAGAVCVACLVSR